MCFWYQLYPGIIPVQGTTMTLIYCSNLRGVLPNSITAIFNHFDGTYDVLILENVGVSLFSKPILYTLWL